MRVAGNAAHGSWVRLAGLTLGLGVGQVKASAVNDFERAADRQPGQEAVAMEGQALGQVAADVHPLVGSPAGAGLAIAAGVGVDLRRAGLAVVVGLDWIEGLAPGGAGIEDLIQKGQAGELGGKEALALRVVGGQEGGVDAAGTEVFQMVEGACAQRLKGVF